MADFGQMLPYFNHFWAQNTSEQAYILLKVVLYVFLLIN